MSNQANRPSADQEWAALLRQLREQPENHPQPFFYARVHARLTAQAQPARPWLPGWARRPAYVALIGTLLLAVSGDGAALRPTAATNPYTNYSPVPPARLLPR